MCLKWQWGRRIDTAQALLSQRQIAVDAFIRQISSASSSTTSQDDDDDDSNKEQNFSDQCTVLSRCTLAIAVAIQVPFPFLELESDSKKS